MKTKPIVISIVVIAALICGFLFARSKYLVKPDKGEIIVFMNGFNSSLQNGNVTSAAEYFDADLNKNMVTMLVNVLSNRTAMGSKTKPIFKVSLNTEDSELAFDNPELPTASVSISFHRDSVPDGTSKIIFTVHKLGPNNYKIYKVDATTFNRDYTKFQNLVINTIIPETDIFRPITLAAFKTAKKLQTRYDSVLWFEHINNKTWYYVMNGKVPDGLYYDTEKDADRAQYSNFKMGLVNPDLKEVIAPEYDLIHNIGGTIDNLIEVEKKGKIGLFDLEGKVIVPAEYDQILPLTDGENLAVLRKDNDYAYLKNDLTIGDVVPDLKIADVLPKVKRYAGTYKITGKGITDVMEFNSREDFTSIFVSPSYMVDLKILPRFIHFPNKLRTPTAEMIGDGDGSASVEVKFEGEQKEEGSWFETAFSSIVNDYLGGRGGLYETKNMLLVDKKQNRILGVNVETFFGEGDGAEVVSAACNDNAVKAFGDSLLEFKSTSSLQIDLFKKNMRIDEGPYYHYFKIVNGKLEPLESRRKFPTQFVKLDDSYLSACYVLNDAIDPGNQTQTTSQVNEDILQYMKNEIYASYRYKFKSARWDEIFNYSFNGEKAKNATVDDSLTVIDKYNIEWINSKLNKQKPAATAAK